MISYMFVFWSIVSAMKTSNEIIYGVDKNDIFHIVVLVNLKRKKN